MKFDSSKSQLNWLINNPGKRLYYQYGINDKKYFTDYYVNIMEKDFDLKLTKIYKDNAEMLNGDGSDVWQGYREGR